MKAKNTVLTDIERDVLLTNLSYRAQCGEDIRWDKVSEVIAKAQAKISFELGIKEVVDKIMRMNKAGGLYYSHGGWVKTFNFNVPEEELKEWGITSHSKQEKLGDIIYKTLSENEITKHMGNRAYIADILSKAIIKNGTMWEIEICGRELTENERKGLDARPQAFPHPPE